MIARGAKRKGQGVVEYAGALVIAAALVSLALFVVPDEIASLLNDINTTALEMFMDYLPS